MKFIGYLLTTALFLGLLILADAHFLSKDASRSPLPIAKALEAPMYAWVRVDSSDHEWLKRLSEVVDEYSLRWSGQYEEGSLMAGARHFNLRVLSWIATHFEPVQIALIAVPESDSPVVGKQSLVRVWSIPRGTPIVRALISLTGEAASVPGLDGAKLYLTAEESPFAFGIYKNLVVAGPRQDLVTRVLTTAANLPEQNVPDTSPVADAHARFWSRIEDMAESAPAGLSIRMPEADPLTYALFAGINQNLSELSPIWSSGFFWYVLYDSSAVYMALRPGEDQWAVATILGETRAPDQSATVAPGAAVVRYEMAVSLEAGARMAVESRYFSGSGAPVLVADDCHRVRMVLDPSERSNALACFGQDGRPTISSEGSHMRTRVSDKEGRGIEWAYFGVDEAPMHLEDGYHRVTSRYNEKGQQTDWFYFDRKGEPVFVDGGYQHESVKYDDEDRRVEWAFFDSVGLPILRAGGYHRETARYTENGRRIEWAYFGTEGEPVRAADGYHRKTGGVTAEGAINAWSYFDAQNKPMLRASGFHKEEFGTDDEGRYTAYFGMHGEPILLNQGYHLFRGWLPDSSSPAGQPPPLPPPPPLPGEAAGNEGRCTYEGAYFGTDGEPVLHEDGYHRECRLSAPRDREEQRTYFGIDGEPVLREGGYHQVRIVRDTRGRNTDWRYYGLKGEPVSIAGGYHHETAEYSDDGDRTAWAYFDIEGSAATLPDGFHRKEVREGPEGRSSETSYWKANGEPALYKGKYHRATWQFKERKGWDRYVSKYFDAAGRPARSGRGCHESRLSVHKWRSLGEQLCLDGNGWPIRNTEGFAAEKWGTALRTFLDENDQVLPAEIVVTGVVPNSRAAELGIQAGDFIERYDGAPFGGSYQAFIDLRDGEPADGEARELILRRGQQRLVLAVEPGFLGVGLDAVVADRDSPSGVGEPDAAAVRGVGDSLEAEGE